MVDKRMGSSLDMTVVLGLMGSRDLLLATIKNGGNTGVLTELAG